MLLCRLCQRELSKNKKCVNPNCHEAVNYAWAKDEVDVAEWLKELNVAEVEAVITNKNVAIADTKR